MNLCKKLALAAALSVGCLGVAAAAEEDTVYLLTNLYGNSPGVFAEYYPMSNLGLDWNGDPSPARVVGDTFVDDFLLNVTSLTTYYVSFATQTTTVGKSVLPDVTFTSLSVSDFTYYYPFASASFTASSFLGSGLTLNAGLYDIEITGVIDEAGGSYSGFVSTNLPEPGEWAMLVAGLGALGLYARRRARDGR